MNGIELRWFFCFLAVTWVHWLSYPSRFVKIFSLNHLLYIFSEFEICVLFFYTFLQVLDGAGLDIDFYLASPEGRTLVFEQRKSDGVHT